MKLDVPLAIAAIAFLPFVFLAAAGVVGLAAAMFLSRGALAGRRARFRSWLERPWSATKLVLVQGALWPSLVLMLGAARYVASGNEDVVGLLAMVAYALVMMAATAVKLAVLVALFLALQRLFAALGAVRVSAVSVGAMLALGFLAVYLPLLAVREHVAPYLTVGTTHLTTHEFVGYDFLPGDRERHEAWVKVWGTGRIQLGEGLFLILLAGVLAAVGRLLGGRKKLGPAAGVVVAVVLCLVACSALDLVTFTYDVFHNGTVAGPLAFELLMPIACFPEDLLMAPFLLVFALVARWGAARGEPAGAATLSPARAWWGEPEVRRQRPSAAAVLARRADDAYWRRNTREVANDASAARGRYWSACFWLTPLGPRWEAGVPSPLRSGPTSTCAVPLGRGGEAVTRAHARVERGAPQGRCRAGEERYGSCPGGAAALADPRPDLTRLPNMTHATFRGLPSPRLAAGLSLLILAGCRSSTAEEAPAEPQGTEPEPAPAMVLQGTAYESAMAITLPPESPEEYEGLHNVFKLSPNVISGSEPHGPEALAELQHMGVKTILSVDGKVPDAAAASALGIRYVHIPVQYKGLTQDELGDIAKTFRELEGPFYVHCFHGKHRGPAAAAVGRIVLDGVSRETALAEMRQYCGTSAKYEGLYRDIATARIPTAEESRALSFDFPSKQIPEGMVGLMVPISRANDNLDALDKRAFAADPEHPDVDAANEARILVQSFAGALDLAEVQAEDDLRAWFQAAHDDGQKLVGALERVSAGDPAAAAEASQAWAAVKASCTACHKAYRD